MVCCLSLIHILSKSGLQEKDINLAIVKDLQQMLSSAGFRVIMTREDDCSIHDPSADTIRERKVSDLHNRLKIVHSFEDCLFTVSYTHLDVYKRQGIIGLVKANGGIDFILYAIKKHVHTARGAQLGIAALSSLVDISTANNTIAIVMAGPIAKDISTEFEISPRRTAALLDIFTSVWQGIIPYGAQLLYASAGAAAAGLILSPIDFLPYLFYPILMGISALIFILVSGRKKKKNSNT